MFNSSLGGGGGGGGVNSNIYFLNLAFVSPYLF